MKINNASIEFSKGSAILKYPITPLVLNEIRTGKLFNFQEMLFENELPASFQKGHICIISEQVNGASFKENEAFNLDDQFWQILSIEIDNVVYPTFLLLRKEGKLTGTLYEAMLDFAVKKTTQKENLPAEAEGHIKEALADMMDLGMNDKMDGEHLEKVTHDFISKIAGNYEQVEAVPIIEKFLASKEIPFKKQDGSYYFTAHSGKYEWHVELEVLAEVQRGVLYSSVSFKMIEDIMGALLRDINQLNQTLPLGHFQIDTDDNILYFKNDVEINIFKLEDQLEQLFDRNFEAMKVIIPVLLEKYNGKFEFGFCGISSTT